MTMTVELDRAERIRQSREARYPMQPIVDMWRRENPDKSLDDLAAAIGVAKITWRRWWESGNGLDWETADHIASRLAYGPDDLWPDMWWPDTWWALEDLPPIVARRQPQPLDDGVERHPANGLALHPDGVACGECGLVTRDAYRVYKCPNRSPGVYRVNANWPACELFEPADVPVALSHHTQRRYAGRT